MGPCRIFIFNNSCPEPPNSMLQLEVYTRAVRVLSEPVLIHFHPYVPTASDGKQQLYFYMNSFDQPFGFPQLIVFVPSVVNRTFVELLSSALGSQIMKECNVHNEFAQR